MNINIGYPECLNISALQKGLIFPFKDFTYYNCTTNQDFPSFNKETDYEEDVYENSIQAYKYFGCSNPLDYSKLYT